MSEKKEVGERTCPKCGELYKFHGITHHGNFICKKDSNSEKEPLNERDSIISDSKYLSHEDDSKPLEPTCLKCKHNNFHYNICSDCNFNYSEFEPREDDIVKDITMSVINEFNKKLLGEDINFIMVKREDLQNNQKFLAMIHNNRSIFASTFREKAYKLWKKFKEEYKIE